MVDRMRSRKEHPDYNHSTTTGGLSGAAFLSVAGANAGDEKKELQLPMTIYSGIQSWVRKWDLLWWVYQLLRFMIYGQTVTVRGFLIE
jgi:dihydroorotate dehydrogenase